ncbi:group I truncated hemoglobin [Candidatus Halobonum tyrrellensis]|uniref:Myoglobin n=1 Tax=Candidatus Halobonum tyrrellensis G22 TaxID=1324957 RepID=V4IZI5_9EURY|nr:group 1 truncated hemoglobin [Candidatus Halobonum tyrrellensis]ESP88547.1 Myoglobin [Candidatus Halobonum tyrrellensis G22]
MADSIYADIGGRDAVEAVVDDFYDRVLADEHLVDFFDGMDMVELRAHQVQFISSVAGGPVDYSGAEMREAHDHLDIDDDDFDRVATHLEAALRENGVGDDHVDAILSEVEALRAPIVGR